MSRSIRLHPEHGVNPTVVQCFWCGKDRGEVALLGAAYKGQAPRQMVLDYGPCDECKGNMARGITLIECVANQPSDGRPELQRGAYPTGKWAVITEDACKRWFPNDAEQILKHRKAFVEPGIIPEEPVDGTPQ